MKKWNEQQAYAARECLTLIDSESLCYESVKYLIEKRTGQEIPLLKIGDLLMFLHKETNYYRHMVVNSVHDYIFRGTNTSTMPDENIRYAALGDCRDLEIYRDGKLIFKKDVTPEETYQVGKEK